MEYLFNLVNIQYNELLSDDLDFNMIMTPSDFRKVLVRDRPSR